MRLYIVRHGETDWNKERLIQGKTDIPLNQNGIFVAGLTANGYKKAGLRFKKVYSSPLKRALTTAAILASETLVPNESIILDDRLKEFDFGDLEGHSLREVHPDNSDDSVLYQCFYQPEEYRPVLGGESYYDIVSRAKDFIEKEILSQSWEDDDNVLVVCHGGVIRAFLCALTDKEIKDFWDTSHKNLSTNIFVLDDKKKTFRLEELSKYYYDVDAYAIGNYR